MNRFLDDYTPEPTIDKHAFAEMREQLEKSALFGFGGKKPTELSEVDQIIADQNKAVDAYKQNTARLDGLNPQARADANQAMGNARKKTETPKPAASTPAPRSRPIQDFGEYFQEGGTPNAAPAAQAAAPKQKLNKGRLGLVAGGTALAAGGAKMGYDKWKEEKVAFADIREELEKRASRF